MAEIWQPPGSGGRIPANHAGNRQPLPGPQRGLCRHLRWRPRRGGDILQAMDEGKFNETDLRAELAELLRGEKPGRTSDEAVTLFKSVGASLGDLAAAIEVWGALNAT